MIYAYHAALVLKPKPFHLNGLKIPYFIGGCRSPTNTATLSGLASLETIKLCLVKRERLVYTIAYLKPSPQDPGLASARDSIGARERAVCSGPTAIGICNCNGAGASPRGPRLARKAFTQVPAVRAVDWRSKAGPVFKTSGAAAGRRKGAEIASGRRPGPDAKAASLRRKEVFN